MARGRPKGSKNRKNIVLNNIFEEPIKVEPSPPTSPEEPKIEPTVDIKKSKIKVVGICDLCGKEVYVSLHQLNLNWLTGKAPWYRNVNTERLKVCGDCALEFNNMVDKYLINKNPLLDKFKIGDSKDDR